MERANAKSELNKLKFYYQTDAFFQTLIKIKAIGLRDENVVLDNLSEAAHDDLITLLDRKEQLEQITWEQTSRATAPSLLLPVNNYKELEAVSKAIKELLGLAF